MAVLPGFLRSRTLRRTVQVRLGYEILRLPGGPPASPERPSASAEALAMPGGLAMAGRQGHLHGLVTQIRELSGLR
jgi:hypothetical protein